MKEAGLSGNVRLILDDSHAEVEVVVTRGMVAASGKADAAHSRRRTSEQKTMKLAPMVLQGIPVGYEICFDQTADGRRSYFRVSTSLQYEWRELLRTSAELLDAMRKANATVPVSCARYFDHFSVATDRIVNNPTQIELTKYPAPSSRD